MTYPNEFESGGELAGSVKSYVAFSIFMFQLSMCGLFTSLINAGDLGLASVIVVSGEALYMLVYKFFNTAELQEIFDGTKNGENIFSKGKGGLSQF